MILLNILTTISSFSLIVSFGDQKLIENYDLVDGLERNHVNRNRSLTFNNHIDLLSSKKIKEFTFPRIMLKRTGSIDNPLNKFHHKSSIDSHKVYSNESLDISEDKYNHPVLELVIKEALYLDLKTKIMITPNSINNKSLLLEKKFIFGKNLETNSFNFDDKETVSEKQFEIIYDKSIYTSVKSGFKNYMIKDCPAGTGVFVKIYHGQRITSNYIILFTTTYLYVYKLEYSKKLKFRFINGPLKDRYIKSDLGNLCLNLRIIQKLE